MKTNEKTLGLLMKAQEVSRKMLMNKKDLVNLQDYIRQNQDKFRLVKSDDLEYGKKYIVVTLEGANDNLKELNVITPYIDEVGKRYTFNRSTIESAVQKYGDQVVAEVRKRFEKNKYTQKRRKVYLKDENVLYVSYSEANQVRLDLQKKEA